MTHSPGPGVSSLLDVTIQMKHRDLGKHLLILKFPRCEFLSALPTGGCVLSSVLPTNPKFVLLENYSHPISNNTQQVEWPTTHLK